MTAGLRPHDRLDPAHALLLLLPARSSPGRCPASSDEDEVGLLVPADDDGIARARRPGRPGAGGVLAPDDQLAGLLGVDPILRLVAEVRALMDASRRSRASPPTAASGRSLGRLDLEPLRADREVTSVAGGRLRRRVGDAPASSRPRSVSDRRPARRRREPPTSVPAMEVRDCR